MVQSLRSSTPDPVTVTIGSYHLGTSRRRLVTTLYTPSRAAPGRPGVLLLPPFGELYTRTAQTLARVAMVLAARGYTVSSVDVGGVGDSYGDLCDQSEGGWRDDVAAAVEDLTDGHECREVVLVVPRTATLYGIRAAPRVGVPMSLLLWSPMVDGSVELRGLARTERRWLRGRRCGRALAPQGGAFLGAILGPRFASEVERFRLQPSDLQGYRRVSVLVDGEVQSPAWSSEGSSLEVMTGDRVAWWKVGHRVGQTGADEGAIARLVQLVVEHLTVRSR